MNRRLLSRLALIALFCPLAWLPASAAAKEAPPPVNAADVVVAELAGETLSAPEAAASDQRISEDELAALAALEAENADLQEQQAGFFGPRIGTLIVIAIILILVL